MPNVDTATVKLKIGLLFVLHYPVKYIILIQCLTISCMYIQTKVGDGRLSCLTLLFTIFCLWFHLFTFTFIVCILT